MLLDPANEDGFPKHDPSTVHSEHVGQGGRLRRRIRIRCPGPTRNAILWTRTVRLGSSIQEGEADVLSVFLESRARGTAPRNGL